MQYETLESVAGLSFDELLVIAGEQIVPKGFGIDSRSPKQKRRDGNRWFEEMINRVRTAVCRNAVIQDFCKNESGADVTLLTTTIASIVSDTTRGVSSFVAAALITRYGLRRLCRGHA